MIASAVLAWSIATQSGLAPWSVLLPDGLKVENALPVDFNKDGLYEILVVGTIIDAVGRWAEMDDSHTVVLLIAYRGTQWEVRSCKEVGQHFQRLQLGDVDGDRVPEVLVFGEFWGADNLTPTLHVLKAGSTGLKFLDGFSGVNGLVEAKDYSGSGRTEIKATNEYWSSDESHAEAHRSISVYFRFSSGSMRPYRALLYDHRARTVKNIGVNLAQRMLHWNVSGSEREPEPKAIVLNPRWITSGLKDCASPTWSPDGKSIAFVAGSGQFDSKNKLEPSEVWVVDSTGQSRQCITNFGDSVVDCPQWSPNGKHIAFRRMPEKDDDPGRGYWIWNVESGTLHQLDDDIGFASWSADSRVLVRDRSVLPIDGGSKRELAPGERISTADWEQLKTGDIEVWRFARTIHLKMGGAVRQLVFKPGNNVEPALSPDGRMLAFSSFKLGTWGIWVADVREWP